MAGFLSSAELDFNSYRESLKNYLKGQDKYKDYDFEGSNMSVLLDLLARNTYHNGFYLNMVGSESFLDSAQLRESVVSRAKELNYIPRSRVSGKTTISLQIIPDDEPSTVVIPKFYTFSSTFGGETYLFSTNEDIVVRNDGGEYIARDFDIYEGRVVTEYFVANTSTRYIISSQNVDISSIDINVQNSLSDTSNTAWTRAYDLYGLNPQSKVFFVQGVTGDKYEVVFGNNITGKAIENGNIVRLTYRDTFGEDGNNISRFSPIRNIQGYSNVLVTNVSGPSTGGGERESIDSIKFNAPRHFATQQRAVTPNDYMSLLRARFPIIETIAVFGGEELPEKKYGRVAITCKPNNGEILPTPIKNEMLDFLKDLTSVSIDPIFIDPDYFYIGVDSTIYFDPTLTTKSIEDLRKDVFQAIAQYNSASLKSFSLPYRHSKLMTAIDNADNSILSNETKVSIIKRIRPNIGREQTYIIEYDAPLEVISNRTSVKSSNFIYTGRDGLAYTAFIEDDMAGKLNIYTIDSLGVKKILNDDLGTVEYDTGKLFINKINVAAYNRYITISASMKNKDFLLKRNQIISIDPTDIMTNFKTSRK